jgi:probable F420-dependent oxidoreductase
MSEDQVVTHPNGAGIVFPQTEIGDDPGAVRAFAETSESLGFEGLMIYDHVVGADLRNRPNWDGWYDLQHSFHEIFVVMGFIAGFTNRIRLVTGIVIAPQRQTVLLAKQAAEVDVLSGGRLTLGIGVGWNDVEFVALNEDFTNRGKRCEEQIEVLRALWTEDSVDFSGKYHHLPGVGIKPLPKQRPIPIYLGGQVDAVLDRVARLGDGWLPMDSPDVAASRLEKLNYFCERAGRDVREIDIPCMINLAGHDLEWVYAQVDSWKQLGATSFYLDTMNCGLRGADAHLEVAARFMSMLAE